MLRVSQLVRQKLASQYRTHYLKDLNSTVENIKVSGFISRIRENSFFDIKDTTSGDHYTLQCLIKGDR